MRTTGIFGKHERSIIVENGKPIYLVFFGDVHYGSPNHCDKEWGRFCEKWAGRDDAYFIAMGDFIDFVSGKERRALTSANLHESTQQNLEDYAEARIAEFVDTIKWMRGRLILTLEGNHYFKFFNGTTTAQHICDHMNKGVVDKEKTAYIGDCGYCRINLLRNRSSRQMRSIDIFLHHGVGFGRTTGASFNAMDHAGRSFKGDIIAMGDNHQRVAANTPQIGLAAKTMDIVHTDQIKIRTGSFLRSYVENRVSYAVDSLYNPASLGAVSVAVTLLRNRHTINGKEYEGTPTVKLEATI